MERKYRIVAKVPLPEKNTVLLRISDGSGMLQGNTTKTIDLETGTKSCNLEEPTVIQSLTDLGIIDPFCLSCILKIICKAVDPSVREV